MSNEKDTIYRQAAIDALTEWENNCTWDDWTNEHKDRMGAVSPSDVIKDLPAAQPKPHWIPCSERLPEDLEEVNVTWVNHDPEPYYNFVKDKPFTATAVYYKEKWYWYTSTCTDMLAEYGRNPNQEIDDGIEIIAWIPLPEHYNPDDISQHMNPPEATE